MNTPSLIDSAFGERLSCLADGAVAEHELDDLLKTLAEDGERGQGARDYWRSLHLAGDALRADDLCRAARPDFSARVAARLALEPALLSPAPLAAPQAVQPASRPVVVEEALAAAGAARSTGWFGMGGLKLASGFATVAAIAVLAGMLGFNMGADGSDPDASGRLAQGESSGSGLALVSADKLGAGAGVGGIDLSPAERALQRMQASANAQTDPSTGLAAVSTQSGVVLRDPQLDAQIAELMNAHRQFGGAAALGLPSGFARSATADGTAR